MIYLLSNCGRNLAAKYKKKGALSMERRNAWKVYDQTRSMRHIRIVWTMERQNVSVLHLR